MQGHQEGNFLKFRSIIKIEKLKNKYEKVRECFTNRVIFFVQILETFAF